MRRNLCYLTIVVVVAALAGWAAAWGAAYYRAHRAAEIARLAAIAEAKRPAVFLGKLVREADEAAIVYSVGRTDKHEVRFSDQVWLSNLVAILEEASYKQTHDYGLWIRYPEIRIYRKQNLILSLMCNGRAMHADRAMLTQGGEISGDLVGEEETTSDIVNLARSKIRDLEDPARGISSSKPDSNEGS